MRPIDADALNIDREHFDTYADYSHAFDMIDNAPTIDAEPVRHGRWVERWVDNKHRIGDMECSVCGAPMLDCPSYSLYCPWCGARMDAERKEE